MRLLRIFILIALVVSFTPLDAFCDDHHDSTEHHHGIVLCHGYCHGAILTETFDININDVTLFSLLSNGFAYEAPFLPTDFRPPISFS